VTWDAFIRFGRVYNSDLLDGPPRFNGTLFARGALRFKPADVDIPLLCDHDTGQEIGRVRKIDEIKDVDGRWYVALATVTEKPPWLKRGTGASFEYKPLASMELNGWKLIQRALVTEVTVTSPTHQCLDEGAKVLLLSEMKEKPKPVGARKPVPQPVVYRQPSVSARHQAEEAEMRRRLDWLERHTGRYDVEAVVVGMQHELQRGSLRRPIIRRNIG
jgi:hypothetical protein